MADPGWYPDPQRRGYDQYYDGYRWTGYRRLASEGSPTGGSPTIPLAGPDPTRALPEPEGTRASPTLVYPAGGGPGYPAGTGGGPGFPAGPGYPEGGGPGFPQPAYPGAAGGGRPYPSAPAGMAPAARRRRWPVVALALVVVAFVVGAGAVYLTHRSPAPAFTFAGQTVAGPAQLLATADAQLQKIVAERHGAANASSRCYFERPAHPVSGHRPTDVAADVACGPVLFVDGTVAQDFLQFGLRAASTTKGAVTLAVATAPTSTQPAAPPAGVTLARPDHLTAPDGPSGVAVPSPPPASANVFVSTSVGSIKVPAAPATARIGSQHGGVALTSLGDVARYATFDDARSAPAGQKLIAFALAAGPSNNAGGTNLAPATTVSVDGAPGRALPAAAGPYYVLAVPTSASSVDLQLTDSGYTQTLSLLNGKAGPHNIAVLPRPDRAAPVGRTEPVTIAFSPRVVAGDGRPESTDTVSLTIAYCSLYFWAGQPATTPGGTSQAWLLPNALFTDPRNPGQNFAFPPGLVSFTPAGGSPIAATNLEQQVAGRLLDAIPVPGDVSSGTLTFSGRAVVTATNGGRYAVSIASPVSVPVTFDQTLFGPGAQ